MSLLLQERSRPHQFLTAFLYTVSVVALLVLGGIAVLTGLMATSIDWSETITAGSEPWVSALVAIGEFVGLAATIVLGMILWHTRRFKIAALVLIALAALLTLWLGIRFIGEYT